MVKINRTSKKSRDRQERVAAPRPSFAGRLRTYFLTGLIVTAPIAITVYLAWSFVAFVDDRISPLIPLKYNPETYLKFTVPGLGIVVIGVGLMLVGFLTANFVGHMLIRSGERLVDRMPVVRTIYGALKQLLETVLKQSSDAFRQCVLVEYPRKGLWTVAFVTGDARGEIRHCFDDDRISIYVPTTPNPTSGFMLFVEREDLIFLDMSVEDGMKLVLSAGMVWPENQELEAANQSPAWVQRHQQFLKSRKTRTPDQKADSA